MQKIASPRELQAELKAIMAFVHSSEKPDREVVASKLRALADRVAAGPSTWEVSLQVTSPSRPKLRHQLQYTVQAKDKKEAIRKAEAIAKKDGNKVVDVVSTLKKR